MVVTVAQQKGGVGKTTTAMNLAAAAAFDGQRVLAIDTDPQFALTRQLGVDSGSLLHSLVEVLAGQIDAASAVIEDVHGFSLLPATRALAGIELSLVGEMGRESFLRDALEPVRESYELIVIDTPPNLGLLTINALLAADLVLAPVSADDEGAAQGLAELRVSLGRLSKLYERQPDLRVLLTKWQPQRVMAEVINEAIGELELSAMAHIPARAAIQHAAVDRVPIVLAAPGLDASIAYHELARDLQRATR